MPPPLIPGGRGIHTGYAAPSQCHSHRRGTRTCSIGQRKSHVVYRSTVDWSGRMAGTTRESGHVQHPKAVAIPPSHNAVGSTPTHTRYSARKVEKGAV